tara:strand:- start:49 stop:303 length:255 start_codon:yes stop_codon:yes gene_type:complete
MKENEKQLKETERILKRLYQNGDMTPEAFTILNDRNKQAINYTHCCESDSEQLQGFFDYYKKKFGNGFNTDVLEITLKQYKETL